MSGSSLPLARNTTVQESKKIQVLRYISLASSFIVALSAGSNYGFSSYSPQLQERLHLTSTQINIVGVMGNMGVYLSGPIWGRLVDKRGLRM
jgi:MFS family permease